MIKEQYCLHIVDQQRTAFVLWWRNNTAILLQSGRINARSNNNNQFTCKPLITAQLLPYLLTIPIKCFLAAAGRFLLQKLTDHVAWI